MGNGHSTPAQACLEAVCGSRSNCIASPSTPLYQVEWVKPYNLDVPVSPAAVIRPDNAKEVAGVVKCAKQYGLKVQAKSGGHSYGQGSIDLRNLGLGGQNGEVVLDLVNLDSFSMDNSTWHATMGGGMKLGKLDQHLHDNGGRAMAHGTCPGVGIGGHATVGGLGPMSRMWGSALDHVIEVEVVTADGKIRRASETQNADLFWAIRGAGASFGVVTEFVVRTHPEPGDIVDYSYDLHFGSQEEMASVYRTWQQLVADPSLDRRFSTIFIAQPLGALITGTFYGTAAEYNKTGIPARMPGANKSLKNGDVQVTDWLGHLAHQAEVEGLALTDLPMHFYSKSLALRKDEMLNDTSIDSLFRYMGSAKHGTLIWVVMFNSEGGAMGDTPANATAYPHRDKILMYQSYAVSLGKVPAQAKSFLAGVHQQIRDGAPTANSTYAGYIDTAFNGTAAEELYWAQQLPRLQQVKRKWDLGDVFSNPQSVRPAAA